MKIKVTFDLFEEFLEIEEGISVNDIFEFILRHNKLYKKCKIKITAKTRSKISNNTEYIGKINLNLNDIINSNIIEINFNIIEDYKNNPIIDIKSENKQEMNYIIKI